MKKPQCPSCESYDVRFRIGSKSFICRRCGNEWKKPDDSKRGIQEIKSSKVLKEIIEKSSLQKEKGSL